MMARSQEMQALEIKVDCLILQVELVNILPDQIILNYQQELKHGHVGLSLTQQVSMEMAKIFLVSGIITLIIKEQFYICLPVGLLGNPDFI